MRANLKLVKPSPTPVNGTVPPKRARNADVRPREYLTPKEVERLIKASRARGRYGARDALAILITYRHGLRAAELADLRWDQVDFEHGLLHVRRVRVQARQRRAGHAGSTALPRAQEHSTHGALYRTVA